MRRVRMVLTAVFLLPLPAIAQTGVTKTEIRSQSPERTAQQMRDQVWGMFELQDMRSKTPPRAMLRDMTLVTPPYPSSTPGICRRDWAVVKFAPVDPGEGRGDADTPVRARGIEVSHGYHQVGALRDTDDRNDGWFHVAGRRACAALKDVNYFDAEDDDAARQSLGVIAALVGVLDSGAVVPTCKQKMLAPGTTCAAAVKGFAANSLSWFGPCGEPAMAGLECAQIDIGGTSLHAHYRPAKDDAPAEIVAVELFDDIVVADTLID